MGTRGFCCFMRALTEKRDRESLPGSCCQQDCERPERGGSPPRGSAPQRLHPFPGALHSTRLLAGLAGLWLSSSAVCLFLASCGCSAPAQRRALGTLLPRREASKPLPHSPSQIEQPQPRLSFSFSVGIIATTASRKPMFPDIVRTVWPRRLLFILFSP